MFRYCVRAVTVPAVLRSSGMVRHTITYNPMFRGRCCLRSLCRWSFGCSSLENSTGTASNRHADLDVALPDSAAESPDAVAGPALLQYSPWASAALAPSCSCGSDTGQCTCSLALSIPRSAWAGEHGTRRRLVTIWSSGSARLALCPA